MTPIELNNEEYIQLMIECGKSWDLADAAKTASYYHEEVDYRCPNYPSGLLGRERFTKYLKLLFRKWPFQEWAHHTIHPHEKKGAYSVGYRFSFGNGRVTVAGEGMDYIEYLGDKIKYNFVYLNANNWPKWISSELA